MSGTGYVIGPQIPEGLALVVEGLAREVLRHRPPDIYEFAAHHFDQLIKLREKGRDDVEIIPQQVTDLFEKTATVRKLTNTRRASKNHRETTNGCGWSIHRTVKALKKHGFKGDVKKEETEKKLPKDHSGNHSPRMSKKTVRGQFLRSLSVGDALSRNIWQEFGEDREHFCGGIVLNKYASNLIHQHERSLKRQKSAGQIERTRGFEITDDERSRSATNGKSDFERKRCIRTASGDGIIGRCRNRRDERDARETRSATNQRRERERERNKVKDEFQDRGETIKKLKLRSEKRESELEVKSKEGKTTNENVASKDCFESLVVFPSVTSRQCFRNSTNDKHDADNENDQSNFVLPPISSDQSRLVEEESNVILPSLSNERITFPNGRRGSNDWKGEAILLETVTAQNSNDVTNRSNVTHFEPTDSTDSTDSIDSTNEKGIENKRQDNKPNDIVFRVTVDETTNAQDELRCASSQGTEVEEFFKDSLNVTPDLIEISQRPDSLERLDDGNASIAVSDAEQADIESRDKEDEEQENQSNELKRKLMELEMMERNIENTLVSSGSVTPYDIVSDARGNDTISTIETKRESTEEKQTKDEEDGEDGENRLNVAEGSPEIDGQENETKGNSFDTWMTAGSNVSSATDRSNDSIKIDPSCYILTEGSPCEIPESVTTVIIPEKGDQDDEIFRFEEEETNRTASSCKSETREEEVVGDSVGDDTDPFGERVCPEAYECSSIDIRLLRGTRNAVDHAAVCQNLGNIKEEEENERDKDDVPRVKLSDDVTSPTDSDDLRKRLETLEEKNFSDRNSTSDSAPNSREKRSVEGINGKEEENACYSREQEKICSSLMDETEPYIPELNLDSLRDVTISSSERSDPQDLGDLSKREREKEKENTEEKDDVSFREGENTLSSFDTLPSEEKATVEDDKVSTLRNESPSVFRAEIDKRFNVSVDNENDNDSSNTEEEIAKELIESLILDALINQEPSEVDESMFVEPNESSASVSVNREETKSDDPFRVKGSDKDDTEVEQVEENEGDQGEHSKTMIEENANEESEDGREKILEKETVIEKPSDLRDLRLRGETFEIAAKKIQAWVRLFLLRHRQLSTVDERRDQNDFSRHATSSNLPLSSTSEEAKEKESTSPNSSSEEKSKETKEVEKSDGIKGSEWSLIEKGNSSGMWHTGEFHDSIPLPIPMTPKSIVPSDIPNKEISKDPCLIVEPGHAGFRGFAIATGTGIDFAPESASLEAPIVYAVDQLRSFDANLPWIDSPLNFLPCFVRVERIPERTSDAPYVSSAESTSVKDVDDVLEPLALDEKPRPSIVIEEISNVDEEQEEKERTTGRSVIEQVINEKSEEPTTDEIVHS